VDGCRSCVVFIGRKFFALWNVYDECRLLAWRLVTAMHIDPILLKKKFAKANDDILSGDVETACRIVTQHAERVVPDDAHTIQKPNAASNHSI
jgi:hypothetical protein